MNDLNPRKYLQTLGSIPDEDIDLAPAALALSALSRDQLNIERYFHHLKKLCDDLAEVVHEHEVHEQESAAQISAMDIVSALKTVMHDHFEYRGNHEDYDNLVNADLAWVIDNRKGLPIALCILTIHIAQSQGWDLKGLNFPGHFFCRVDHGGERILFDPFYDFKILEAPDLRAQLKKSLGPEAELTSGFFEESSNRDILFRLQNNIKLRQIASEDYDASLKTVNMMRLIDPYEYRLALDAGVLNAKLGNKVAAIAAIEFYLEKAPESERYDAELLLRELQASNE